MDDDTAPEPIRADQYVPPMAGRKAFHCLYCNVYAQQSWQRLALEGMTILTRARLGTCENCRAESLWWTKNAQRHIEGEDPHALLVVPAAMTAARPLTSTCLRS